MMGRTVSLKYSTSTGSFLYIYKYVIFTNLGEKKKKPSLIISSTSWQNSLKEKPKLFILNISLPSSFSF